MSKKPVKTFHPLDVIKSLEAQNQAVGMLLATCESLLTLGAVSAPGVEMLRKQIDACSATFYPTEGE